jgi:hypothetical protein
VSVVQAELTIGQALDLLRRELHVEALTSFDMDTEDNAHIALPNGWTVSVGFGTRHHCANYGPPDRFLNIMNSPDCEVAIVRPDDAWFLPHDASGEEAGRQVWKEVPARTLLAVVDAVATCQEGDRCPCPDCVRERALR